VEGRVKLAMFLAVGQFEFRLVMPVADLIRTPHYVQLRRGRYWQRDAGRDASAESATGLLKLDNPLARPNALHVPIFCIVHTKCCIVPLAMPSYRTQLCSN
jgi:hypothetical protein